MFGAASRAEEPRPNILWITCEDMSPNLGCYGDAQARTPVLDAFAREGVRYTRAFATAPVCSPVRSCLITGAYATALGTENLRSLFPIPAAFHGFPSYLRRAGYYCSNNVKTDYNTSEEPRLIRESWDDCSATAHWRNRPPGRPFFSVFNLMTTHQSRTCVWPFEQFEAMIREELKPEERADPARLRLPPFYPDTPLVRRTWARYYDCITAMDKQVGRLLKQLEEDGLADDTIVFFYSDHGMGMPRGKRTLYDTGLRVPLIIRFPERFRALAPADPGETTGRLVSFVDFAPTVLSLAGAPVPPQMQGTAFLGLQAGPPRSYIYGARDRVDEAYDLSRAVRDDRYLYIRNFMPHLSWNQPEGYSDQAGMRRQITRLAREGKLNAAQLGYAGPRKPIEELYDTRSDPWQIHNLAGDARYRAVLERLRRELRRWILRTRDLGFLPEWERRRRMGGRTPYELARDPAAYPLGEILEAAELVGRTEALSRQAALLRHPDAAARYWAAVGLHAAGPLARAARGALRRALTDPCANVRIEAAAALAGLEESPEAIEVLRRELRSRELDAALHAARQLQFLGPKAAPALADIRTVYAEALRREKEAPHYLFLQFSLKPLLEQLKAAPAAQ